MSLPSSGALPGSQSARYFSLRWNSHPVELVSGFTGLYQSETLVDVTLAAEGKHLQAHKMLLSACSDYFQSLFSINPCQHPIVILKDVKFDDLRTIVQFMYDGTVNVSGEKLPDIMKIAETLQIKGLAGGVVSTGTEPRTPKLLSVMSQQSGGSRQLSTESLPEYLHRTHEQSPRDPSLESRQYSVESMSAVKRNPPSPPTSPHRHFRKKFRRLSGAGSSSERGNSIEDDRSPGGQTLPRVSPQPIHLSPSRQSSSSTEHESAGITVAKKKRELFSARSSRSGGSNKSSASEYSRDYSFSSSKQQESTGSSGQSQSLNQSQDDGGGTNNIPPQTSSGSTLTVPVTISGRSLSRSHSIADPNDENHQPSKRSRFLLRRQDCLEKGNEGELDLTAPPPPVSIQPPTPTDIKCEHPDSPLPMVSSFPSLASPHPSFERDPTPPMPQRAHTTPVLTKQRSAPLLSSDSHDLPPLLPKPPPYSPSHPPSPHSQPHYHDFSLGSPLSVLPGLHHPIHHNPPPAAHSLPSVRVIPDAASPQSCHDSMRMDSIESHMSHNSALLHPTFRSKSTETPPFPDRYDSRSDPQSRRSAISVMQSSYHNEKGYMQPHPMSHPPSPSSAPSTLSIVSSLPIEQFGHCPKARDGPALGCNYCWNTTDPNGRILRRKTKYHCPDCQANLCIVPCFQAYHEQLEKDKVTVTSH